MTFYQHRQFSTTIVAILAVIGAVVLATTAGSSAQHIGWLVGGILLASGIVFSSLSIEITRSHLRWSFGPGLIRKQVPLAEIADCEPTRTRLWEGWGIHLTFRGWLYNVSGFDAVKIRTTTGKQFMLGTDEPARLAEVLSRIVQEGQAGTSAHAGAGAD